MKFIQLTLILFFSSYAFVQAEHKQAQFNSIEIGIITGKSNKNFSGDSFTEVNAFIDFIFNHGTFKLTYGRMQNRQKGYDSCLGDIDQYYDIKYKSTYILPEISLYTKYIGAKIIILEYETGEGWCETSSSDFNAVFYSFNIGILDKMYFSFGEPALFRISGYDDLLYFGLTYLWDNRKSEISSKIIGTPHNWGFNVTIKKRLFAKFLLLFDGSYFKNLRILSEGFNIENGKLTQYHSKVNSFNIGIGYILFSKRK